MQYTIILGLPISLWSPDSTHFLGFAGTLPSISILCIIHAWNESLSPDYRLSTRYTTVRRPNADSVNQRRLRCCRDNEKRDVPTVGNISKNSPEPRGTILCKDP